MVKSKGTTGENSCPNDLNQNVEDWLEDLHHADETFYNMMSIEIWSIAQTMDEISPGFWSQFMRNRQAIVKQQIQERQQRHIKSVQASKWGTSVANRLSPLQHEAEQSPPMNLAERVDSFSEVMEQGNPVRKSIN